MREELLWTDTEPVYGTNPVNASLRFVGEIGVLFFASVRAMLSPRWEWKEILHQMAFIGAASVPIVVITTTFSGAVLALYGASLLVRFGAGSLSGGAVGLAIVREIAPVLTAIMVAARCGSAIAAQIGSMKVTEQIDALRALAVNPVSYLVVPRLVACLIMIPILCTVANFAGILGGAAVASMLGVSAFSYFRAVQLLVLPFDFTGGVLKTIFFALIVALIGCHQGLTTRGGAAGVGQATTRAVVISMVLIYISNYFLADVLFAKR